MAGLLNRTLLMPIDPANIYGRYDMSIAFDVSHFRRCWGDKVILTVEEYVEQQGRKVEVDYVKTWGNSWDPNHDSQPARALEGLRDITLKPGVQVVHSGLTGNYASPEDFLREYGNVTADVLMIGHTFTVSVMDTHGFGDMSPFARSPECPVSCDMKPADALTDVASKFIASVPEFTEGFVAIHLRRGDFALDQLKYNVQNFYPIPQVALWVREHINLTRYRSIFLATDGSSSQVGGARH